MNTLTIRTPAGETPLTVAEHGTGRPILLLHGGAGLDSIAGLAERLAAEQPARVITPVHPGFGGTPRPEWLADVPALAQVYRALLQELDLSGVTVMGSSLGGWTAAELALAAPERLDGLVLIDAVGIASERHPVAGYFGMTLDQVIEISFADPDSHRIDPTTFTDEQRAIAAGNQAALRAYGGTEMNDPSLAARLAAVTVPTQVIWGEADGMVTPAYGREFAAAIPGAQFHLLPNAGHLPQLETPTALLKLLATNL